MKSTTDYFSFKDVLKVLPRGEPLDVSYLKENGLSTQHAAHLAKAGWLTRLGRGAYMLPGDKLTRDGCLAFLMRQHASLHVGGKTALSWRGVRHNITFSETITLWGGAQLRLPAWYQNQFRSTYQTTSLFDATLPSGFGIQPLPGGDLAVRVSGPERALLELLSDVGKTEVLQDTRNLVESTHSLRLPVLKTLLTHTKRIKVLRLARELSEHFELPWAKLAKEYSDKKGGGTRWIAVTKTGERLDLKR